ncbi:6257_t:CDS:2, partial [Dentiscutata heterogama]
FCEVHSKNILLMRNIDMSITIKLEMLRQGTGLNWDSAILILKTFLYNILIRNIDTSITIKLEILRQGTGSNWVLN